MTKVSDEDFRAVKTAVAEAGGDTKIAILHAEGRKVFLIVEDEFSKDQLQRALRS